MPKISVSQGPTYGEPDPERVIEPESDQDEQEVESSPGTNSSRSTETSEKTHDGRKRTDSPPKPVRSTVSHSK